jgi:hypothetical protein
MSLGNQGQSGARGIILNIKSKAPNLRRAGLVLILTNRIKDI